MPTRLPDRPSDSGRSTVHLKNDPVKNRGVLFAFLLRFPSSNSRVLLGRTANIEFVRIPQRVRIEHGRMEISDPGIRARKNVGRPQKNEGEIFGDQLLRAIV